MDRPATSKARGACRYYMTPRGCFAGDNCKFLHGQEQNLTPYDQSKSCRFYAQGYCRRGDKCWFRHGATGSSMRLPGDELTEPSAMDDVCNICLEKPITYGLLIGCGHIFCIKCIRQWRDPAGKSGEMSDVIKRCPLCRASSRYITPSSIFFTHNHPGKAEAINKYKASMARVPCRYFQLSRPSKRFCPFGKDCFYQHLNDDGTEYIFPKGINHFMRLYKLRQHRGAYMPDNVAYHTAAIGNTNPLNLFRRLFSSDPLEDIHATIETIRTNLPALLDRWNIERDQDDVTDDEDDENERYRNPSNGSNNGDNSDYGDVDPVETLERLADRMLERLVALRDSTQPSPSPASRSDRNSTRAFDDDLPPLEPLESGSLSSESLSSPDTPSPVPVSPFYEPPSVATAATSRFSTVVGNRSQERVLIDLASEDEFDEGEDESSAADLVEPALVVDEPSQRSEDAEQVASGRERVMLWRDNNAMQESSPSAQTTETSIFRMPADLDIGRQTIANDSVNDNDSPIQVFPMHHERDQPEHDAEPPFVTDGRGRVVWSRMRSARGAQVVVPRESPQPPQAQAGTTTTERRIKSRRPVQDSNSVASTTSSSAFMTDGRGRVIWTGPPVQADAAVGGDGETAATEIDEGTEYAVTAVEPSRSGPGRSFFGRVYDVVFS